MAMELSVSRSLADLPARPGADGGLEVWRDNDGAPLAYGFTDGGANWIEYPGVGTFRFSPDSRSVDAFAESGASTERLRDAYQRAVLPLVIQALGKEVLHASGVLMPRGAVALFGRSGSGKSTLAYALGRRGHTPFADDAVVVEQTGRQPSVSGVPFALRLLPNSARHLGNADGVVEAVDQVVLEDRSEPLAALVALEQVADLNESSLEATWLSPPAAFTAILTHAYCFSARDPERKRLMMERYLELTTHTAVLRLRFAPGLERLSEMLDVIETQVRDFQRPE